MRDDTPDRIKACRERLKGDARKNGGNWRQWTQDGVSKRLDVDLSTYQRWESGERSIDVAQLKKIATVFGLPPHEFFGTKAEPAPEATITLSDLARGEARILEILEKRLPDNSEIDRLKAENSELQRKNETLEKKAEKFRLLAEAEQLRADLLEGQLKSIDYDKTHKKYRSADPKKKSTRFAVRSRK